MYPTEPVKVRLGAFFYNYGFKSHYVTKWDSNPQTHFFIILRVLKTHDLLVVETDGNTKFISQKDCKKTTQIDYETGEILGEDLEPNNTVISKLFEIFGNTLEVQ